MIHKIGAKRRNVHLLLQVAWSTLEGTDGSVHVYRYADGVDLPGGTFTLAFKGNTSPPIPWNASAVSMKAALESLPQVGDVAVVGHPTVAAVDSSSTVSAWLIEFTTVGTPANIGDLPLLEADGSFLSGTASGVVVEEVSAGCCTVEVSANGGEDYTDVSDSEGDNTGAFRYQDRAVVKMVAPNAGPASGGTPVTLSGAGFDLPSDVTLGTDSDFVCVFGGRLDSPALRLSSTVVTCTSPPTPRREVGAMSVAVRWRGSVALSVSTAAFTYFEDVTLEALIPSRGSNAGGYSSLVSIGRGSFMAMGLGVTCAVEVRLPSNLTSGYTAREFTGSAEKLGVETKMNYMAEVTRARILSKEVYVCEMPGLDEFFKGVTADAWLDNDWGATALVSLSGNNGVNRTAPLTFTYVPKPAVFALEPSLGVDGGGTSVTVHGTRYEPPPEGYDKYELLCRFGDMTPAPARYISDSALECTSSPHANVAAIMSVVVEGASVFHGTQEVLLRIPSPRNQENATSRYHLVSGTWTLSLENVETYAMDANVTAADMALALSALPSIGNVTVTAEHRILSDPYAGLSWNETAFTVHFVSRGGNLPILSANESNLFFASSRAALTDVSDNEVFALPALAPEVEVRSVEEGHDGSGVVREVQVLRTNRSGLSAEVQTVTVATATSPTAEVSLLSTYSDSPFVPTSYTCI